MHLRSSFLSNVRACDLSANVWQEKVSSFEFLLSTMSAPDAEEVCCTTAVYVVLLISPL